MKTVQFVRLWVLFAAALIVQIIHVLDIIENIDHTQKSY